MSPPASPLLGSLRAATRPHHDALEALTYGDAIMDGSLTMDMYHRLLEWQRKSHLRLEPEVIGFAESGYAYVGRFSIPATHLHGTRDRARQLGVLYVLEGASLGGSVILRKLRANPRLTASAPFTFYERQAERGIPQWRAYLGMVNGLRLSGAEIERATAGAVGAFKEFEHQWHATA